MKIDLDLKLYPYAAAHDPWTGALLRDEWKQLYCEDISLPRGWRNLFRHCMMDIYRPLQKLGLVDKFYFTRVTARDGVMVIKADNMPEEIKDIIAAYEYLSQYICEFCGKPAVKRTVGYPTQLCADCNEKPHTWYKYQEKAKDIEVCLNYNGQDLTGIWSRLWWEENDSQA